jgi:hypothetical protein
VSYNIGICLPPVPRDDGEAWKHVDALSGCAGAPAPEFVELHAALTARYSCICSLSEDAVDDGVWSDGPLINNFGERAAVIGLVYSRVDEVLPVVIEAATARGMVVFDWATETVHRPSGRPQQVRRPWWRFW